MSESSGDRSPQPGATGTTTTEAPVVLVERPDPAIALLRINRPQARNALNLAVRMQLGTLVDAMTVDADVRCIVITGDEKAFAAGADLREMAEKKPVDLLLLGAAQRAWQALVACPKPVIAAVNGFAWGGGCELAMHCDLIVAGEGATFCQPEVKVGIMPGAGGTQRLTRAVGKFKAMRMLLTGLPVSAAEAERMGLASEVVPDDQVLSRALELARIIASMPPLAIQQIKEVVHAGMDSSLDAALRLERKAFQLLFASEDQREGAAAFFAKRKPEFRGR
jgi:enoyl-CoA hydratase/carnithine racemase